MPAARGKPAIAEPSIKLSSFEIGARRAACHFCGGDAATSQFAKPAPRTNTPDIKSTGGSVMTSRLALCAAVAATVIFSAGASAQTYEVTKLVPGSAFHGVHGLGIDKAGRLFAGSVAGAALYEVDIKNGTAKIAIPTPEGMADDIAIAPDGTMAWTGFLTGDLYARKGDGPIRKLASGLPGINSLAYRKDGRLYPSTVFLGGTLYEIDVEGGETAAHDHGKDGRAER